jgi:hypothetical protein
VWEVMVFMCGLLPDAATAVGVMGLCIQVRGVCHIAAATELLQHLQYPVHRR